MIFTQMGQLGLGDQWTANHVMDGHLPTRNFEMADNTCGMELPIRGIF